MQRRIARRSIAVVWALLAALLFTSCNVDWATWGNGIDRQGYNGAETVLSTSNVSQLQHKWATDLGVYINAAPIVATGINIAGTPTDVVYVGTEHGDFYAVSTTGQILWSRNLGSNTTNCPDTPDKIYGVSASAVFERSTNRVYVAGGDGKVYALNPSTGAILAGWPVTITTDPTHEFVYDAPNVFNGNLYVGLASRCDIRPYHGRVVRIVTATQATSAFYVTGSPTGTDGGGVWGWGGVSIDAADGDVYVGTANVFTNPENAYYGDAIVRLNPDLSVQASNSPGVGRIDDGFGSTPTLFQKPGCPKQLASQMKNGGLYLYDRDSIASGSRQRVPLSTFSINVPAWSPATQMLYVLNGGGNGIYVKGLAAFRLNAECNLELAWQSPSPVRIGSAPVIANGVVYYTDGFNTTIHAVDATTGQSLWSSGSEVTTGVLAAPAVVNGQLFASSYDRKLHAYGLP